jgi:hypothetical protein
MKTRQVFFTNVDSDGIDETIRANDSSGNGYVGWFMAGSALNPIRAKDVAGPPSLHASGMAFLRFDRWNASPETNPGKGREGTPAPGSSDAKNLSRLSNKGIATLYASGRPSLRASGLASLRYDRWNASPENSRC